MRMLLAMVVNVVLGNENNQKRNQQNAVQHVVNVINN